VTGSWWGGGGVGAPDIGFSVLMFGRKLYSPFLINFVGIPFF